jgi:hypothetical protein
MTQLTTATTRAVSFSQGAVRVAPEAREQVRAAVLSFLDAAVTATGRETFYNTREEQQAAELAVHQAVWRADRGLYAALLALPGVNDHPTQVGLQRLLDEPHPGEGRALLGQEQEARLLEHLAGRLPPQRLFKLFVALRQARVNNRRTRRLILRSILGSGKLPFWAVKYRLKLRAALRHALGTGVANGVRDLTARADLDGAGRARLDRYLGRYLPEGADRDTVRQCVCFILGGRRDYTVPLLRAFGAARTDLELGANLPVEVLGGIRSRFHKDVPAARVLELARQGGGITEGQKLALQRSAARHEVELEFDPQRADIVRLYVYALECGMSDEVRSALDRKALDIAAGLPLRYGRVGIVRREKSFGRLWPSIAEFNRQAGLEDQGHAGHLEFFFQHYRDQLDTFVAQFEPVPEPVGCIVLIGGKVAGVERTPSANRAWWYDCPEAAEHYEEPREAGASPRRGSGPVLGWHRGWNPGARARRRQALAFADCCRCDRPRSIWGRPRRPSSGGTRGVCRAWRFPPTGGAPPAGQATGRCASGMPPAAPNSSACAAARAGF